MDQFYFEFAKACQDDPRVKKLYPHEGRSDQFLVSRKALAEYTDDISRHDPQRIDPRFKGLPSSEVIGAPLHWASGDPKYFYQWLMAKAAGTLEEVYQKLREQTKNKPHNF